MEIPQPPSARPPEDSSAKFRILKDGSTVQIMQRIEVAPGVLDIVIYHLIEHRRNGAYHIIVPSTWTTKQQLDWACAHRHLALSAWVEGNCARFFAMPIPAIYQDQLETHQFGTFKLTF